MFRLLAFTAFAAILGLDHLAQADSLRKLSDVAFQQIEDTITEIESKTESQAIIQEISVARRLVKHGKLLLRAGRTKKAAVFAERLQFQIELIRALLAASNAVVELATLEREILEMELKLKMLKDRLHRLMLETGDAKVPGSMPNTPERANGR